MSTPSADTYRVENSGAFAARPWGIKRGDGKWVERKDGGLRWFESKAAAERAIKRLPAADTGVEK